MRISKVYTRAGDAGTTSLVGGEKVPKDSARIESYGTVDELQSVLGLLRAELTWTTGRAGPPHPEERRRLVEVIHRVQNDLFDLGNMLSTPEEHADRVPNPVTAERIAWLEERMDAWNEGLPPLRSFILSGGGRTSALAHHARTVCRRCERRALAFSREAAVAPEVLGYLNRLSDLLFVLGRHLARLFDEEEPLWETPLGG